MAVPDSPTLFSISNTKTFEACALAVFKYQYATNEVYHEYCSHLGITPKEVSKLSQIPFLPIAFFKEKKVISGKAIPTHTFES
ncbi:MAG: acyl transferase, partial [Bacteroidota bacterium]